MKKLLKILGLFLGLNILIIGCSNTEALPIKLDLEDSIKEIILSKGENYDFLNDNVYIEYMEDLANKFSTDEKYAIGHLNGNNIPELVIFNEKDSSDVDDEGSLDVYSFDGTKYALLDTINMSFDNSNYEMKIGKISENQRGILLNNNIGTHSGLTYGFVLEDGKLKSILNDKKVPLISIYTDNEIKDINNDGILNFSVITIDPETEDITIEGSDKMTLWYKWNGKDSATLIKVEREDYSKKDSNKRIFNKGKNLISNDFLNSLDFIIENKDALSKFDLSILIKDYIENIKSLSSQRGSEINDLFYKDGKDQNVNYVSGNSTTSIENLNSLEYLNREKILKDNQDIKKHLIDNINLGLKLNMSEGMYYYSVDYQKFINLFDEDILNEYMDYLQILAFNSNEPFMDDGSLMIGLDHLIERILYAESFKMIYPYSDLLPEIHEIYSNYINIFFFGDLHNPNFDQDTKIMKEKALEQFKEVASNYEFTNFAYIINDFLIWLQENNNIVDDFVREKLYNRLN